MSPERYIPVYIDAKPAENIDPSTQETLCFMGLLANHQKGIPNLKAYKDTRRQRKLREAVRIVEHLSNGSIEVDAIAVVGKTNGAFAHWSFDAINRAREMIGAEWEVEGSTPVRLKWNGYTFGRSNLLGLCLYSQMLPIIAQEAERRVRRDPVKKIKLCLDRLPHNSAEGIQLMDALRIEPDLAEMWKLNQAHGFTFPYGTLESFEDDQGNEQPGKNHPNAILVDWLAVSCLAKTNPDQLQREGSYSDIELEVIRAIWDTAQNHTSATIINVDDPEIQRKAVEHSQRLNEQSNTKTSSS